MLAWPALVFAALTILSVLVSAGIATWEWSEGNTSPKAGWEGFPIMVIILTMASGIVSLVTLVYVLMKGPIRLPFSEKRQSKASNQQIQAIAADRGSA